MMEALCYGTVAALTFIGFVFLVYFALLRVYRPKGNGSYVLFVSADLSHDEIISLVYGAYLRNIIYGDLLSNDVFIIDDNLSEEKKVMIKSLSADYGCISFIGSNDIVSFFKRKEKNGAGFC